MTKTPLPGVVEAERALSSAGAAQSCGYRWEELASCCGKTRALLVSALRQGPCDEKGCAGLRARRLRAQPGAGLAGGALAARPAVPPRTAAILALSRRSRCPGREGAGSPRGLSAHFRPEGRRDAA